MAVFGLAQGASALDVPANDGYVTDTAGVLSAAEQSDLEETLRVYQQETSNQIAILIVNSLEGEPIADAAVQVGRKWGVGTKENDNGILILVAYTDREIFLATGYGLEGAVPDIVTKGIIEEEILPEFRDGDYAGGLKAGIAALEKHIGGEYTADRYDSGSTGPGAFAGFLFFAGILLLQWLIAFLGRSKSWWLGGVLGAVCGLGLVVIFSWWWSIPLLFFLGLLIDSIASKTYRTRSSRRGRGGKWGGWGSGGFGSGGGGGGGFGGFGGGSFGGGGAGGRW
ncbi:hypothetical protein AUJ46_02155 [Candidatus Peregrinibacteria bacterium CG1_02_54_53]|nr:MAG: hypothetical protein AUJ46_02155 [Candidatus Peregrinibacteria bacterium CG1_02_54_53]